MEGGLKPKLDIDYKWTIKFEKFNKNIDGDIFPMDTFIKYLKLYRDLQTKLGEKFREYTDIVTPLHNAMIGKNSILKYNYDHLASVEYYHIIRKYNLPLANTLIVTNSVAPVDTLIHYQKFINYVDPDLRVAVNRLNPKSALDRLLKENRIVPTIFFNRLKEIDGQYDFIIIDLNISINNLEYIDGFYGFQTIIANFVSVIKRLNRAGSLLMRIPTISNRAIYNLILFIMSHFSSPHLIINSINYPAPHRLMVLCKTYQKVMDTTKLEELVEKAYSCDPSGGMNYEVVNSGEEQLIQTGYKSAKPPGCYLVESLQIDGVDYKKYCRRIKRVLKNKVALLQQLYSIRMDPTLIANLREQNRLYAISYAKKIDIGIASWVDPKGINDLFFNKVFREIMNHVDPYISRFIHVPDEMTIKLSKKLEYHDVNHLENLTVLNEISYEYSEKTNDKRIELFFNNLQKNLQRTLFKKGVNINGKPASRAFLKLYELYAETDYFANLSPTLVKVLHVCEAPGNFIASSLLYAKNKGFTYDWNAQTLKDGADVYDQYGFIKNNIKRWDFGDGTGDITKNLRYYYNKYRGIDSMVGDCGIGWSANNDLRKNISIYQLLYALLLPRAGGNFIIKAFSINFDLQFLSLIYTVAAKYKKLFIFRSSRNFWSPEIYIVGIEKKELTELEEKAVFEIENDYMQGKTTYPVAKIDPTFSLEYEYHIQNIIFSFTEVKKFFVYLARNNNIFEKSRKLLEEAIEKKNRVYIEKYLPKL